MYESFIPPAQSTLVINPFARAEYSKENDLIDQILNQAQQRFRKDKDVDALVDTMLNIVRSASPSSSKSPWTKNRMAEDEQFYRDRLNAFKAYLLAYELQREREAQEHRQLTDKKNRESEQTLKIKREEEAEKKELILVPIKTAEDLKKYLESKSHAEQDLIIQTLRTLAELAEQREQLLAHSEPHEHSHILRRNEVESHLVLKQIDDPHLFSGLILILQTTGYRQLIHIICEPSDPNPQATTLSPFDSDPDEEEDGFSSTSGLRLKPNSFEKQKDDLD